MAALHPIASSYEIPTMRTWPGNFRQEMALGGSWLTHLYTPFSAHHQASTLRSSTYRLTHPFVHTVQRTPLSIYLT